MRLPVETLAVSFNVTFLPATGLLLASCRVTVTVAVVEPFAATLLGLAWMKEFAAVAVAFWNTACGCVVSVMLSVESSAMTVKVPAVVEVSVKVATPVVPVALDDGENDVPPPVGLLSVTVLLVVTMLLVESRSVTVTVTFPPTEAGLPDRTTVDLVGST